MTALVGTFFSEHLLQYCTLHSNIVLYIPNIINHRLQVCKMRLTAAVRECGGAPSWSWVTRCHKQTESEPRRYNCPGPDTALHCAGHSRAPSVTAATLHTFAVAAAVLSFTIGKSFVHYRSNRSSHSNFVSSVHSLGPDISKSRSSTRQYNTCSHCSHGYLWNLKI